MFEQSLVETNGGACKPAAVAASSIGQVLLIGILIVAPLLSTSELPQVWLTGILRAPSVPPPPPPAPNPDRPRAAPMPRREFVPAFTQPRVIPEEVAIIIDEPAPDLVSRIGVEGGTGSPDGTKSGVINSILSGSRRAIALPPPPPRPEPAAEPEPEPIKRYRVGGEVEQPVLVKRVEPVYSALARQVRVQGAVQLECIVGADGRVRDVRAVSGHPLLAKAAVEAVSQWLYRPTLLNGNPVEVLMQVTVNFTLR